MIGNELEELLRKLIREELARALDGQVDIINSAGDDELRRRVAERAAKLQRARGGR